MRTIALILISMSFLFSGCDEENPKEINENVSIATYYDISIKDSQGIDLLDPENAAINRNDISVYYLIDGERKKVHNANYDYPGGFFIAKSEQTEQYYMRIFVNENHDSDSVSTTYIEFNSQEI